MKNITSSQLISVLITSTLLSSCGGETGEGNNALQIFSPLSVAVISPADNPSSIEKNQLGQLLFWDPILSGNQDVACATCHHPDKGYADALPLSIGVGGHGLGENRMSGSLAKRNASTILNTAFNGIDSQNSYDPTQAQMFWDNRVRSLEHQAKLPILSQEEMRGEDIAEDQIMTIVIERLEAIPEYKQLFLNAFGTSVITETLIFKAIASFERSLIANNSRFDQFLKGDSNALTAIEQEGLEEFVEVGCAECHSGPMLSDYQLHVIGTPDLTLPNGTLLTDMGAGQFDFRTPTLRNLNLTGPYMHNGIFETLEEVVQFYQQASQGENIHPSLSLQDLAPQIQQLDMGDGDGGDEEGEGEGDNNAIVSFLKSLQDDQFDKTIPESVPSSLQPGGNI
jgi:cytochrome c peroxidase